MLQRAFPAAAWLYVVLAVWAPPPLRAQSSGSVIIDSDIRLYTAMAALNAAGFDFELGPRHHPVREALRKQTESLPAELTSRLREFYQSHKGTDGDDTQLARYISYAVTATDPPDFKPSVREELLPPDARQILAFGDLMREVYAALKLTAQWAELRPQYDRAVSQIAPRLREMIVQTDAYLRIPLGGVTSRNMFVFVELAAPVNSVNIRSYQDNYFAVLGHSNVPKFEEIRHAYLHFLLDGLVIRNITRMENGKNLLSLLDGVDGVQIQYTADLHIMAIESLIRAVELRLDRVPVGRANDSVQSWYRQGLLLTPYFHEALSSYESSEGNIREIFKDMATGVNVGRETQRFQETFHKIPLPAKTAIPTESIPVSVPEELVKPDPVRELLKQGEAAMATSDHVRAREAFDRVLSGSDPENGPALYGLGLIASREEDRERALDFLGRAVKARNIEPGMKVWAHIFLGRIHDLECEREEAEVQYKLAIEAGDNTRNAQAAAREGLAKPFGGGCR